MSSARWFELGRGKQASRWCEGGRWCGVCDPEDLRPHPECHRHGEVTPESETEEPIAEEEEMWPGNRYLDPAEHPGWRAQHDEDDGEAVVATESPDEVETAPHCQFGNHPVVGPPEPFCCAERRRLILKLNAGEHPAVPVGQGGRSS